MKIILRQDYAKLGKIGEVVDVKDGFARNFLIPRNIGYQATEGNIRALDEEKKQHDSRQGKEVTRARKLAVELEKTSVTLKMKVGEDERLFGTVTSQMVADALAEKGFTVDKRIIETEEPIKALGIYSVNLRLHPSVETKVKVWVVRE
ncbi:MAG TPA: 50S ribosomal protein L9 [Bacteroidota bacterium]|nr:50S ribosomal protein L9 [Bacteroidota bacterium]